MAATSGPFLTRNVVKLPTESVLAFFFNSWVQLGLAWLNSAQVEGCFRGVVPHTSSSILRTNLAEVLSQTS